MRVGKQQVVPVEGFSPAVGSRGQDEGKKAEMAGYQAKSPPSTPTDFRVQGPVVESSAHWVPCGLPSSASRG